MNSMQIKQLRRSAKQQRGFGIIGMLFALAIGALLVYQATEMYNKSLSGVSKQAAVTDIVSIIAETKALYGQTNQYANVTTAVAVQGGVTGKRRVGVGDTAQNPYNGAITFAPATITIANDSLNMGYASVLREECQYVVSNTENTSRQIQVAGTDVKPADGVLNVATLAAQCNSAARVDINFIFGRN